MENLTQMERKFFENMGMKTTKISVNLSTEAVSKLDELADMLKVTRTLAIEIIIKIGLPSYLDMLKSASKKIHKTQSENKEQMRLVADVMKKLEAFEKKWNMKETL